LRPGTPTAARGGRCPVSSRVCTRNATSGDVMTSSAAARAVSGAMPWLSYIDASSAVSAAALRASSRRSTASSRSTSSFWADTLIHSPAAIEMPPAIAPASPARRTMDESAPEPAKPRISDTFDTSPSLIPNTAARASPRTPSGAVPRGVPRASSTLPERAESAWCSARPRWGVSHGYGECAVRDLDGSGPMSAHNDVADIIEHPANDWRWNGDPTTPAPSVPGRVLPRVPERGRGPDRSRTPMQRRCPTCSSAWASARRDARAGACPPISNATDGPPIGRC
jgi:hypothetical protein